MVRHRSTFDSLQGLLQQLQQAGALQNGFQQLVGHIGGLDLVAIQRLAHLQGHSLAVMLSVRGHAVI